MIVPVSLVIILFLLYTTFNSLTNALLVLVTVPFALIGGIFSLVFTGTHFSISAAVGVISTLGVAILGGVLLISRIEDFRRHGLDLREAVLKGADVQMRPILMATLAAAIGFDATVDQLAGDEETVLWAVAMEARRLGNEPHEVLTRDELLNPFDERLV